MADLISDGMIRVYWVPTIADIAAPTVAELDAGTRLDTLMTPDGWAIQASTSEVDTSKLSSTYDTVKAGRRKFAGNIKLTRQTGTDTVYTTLVYQATGYLVRRDNVSAGTAWTAAQKVKVYPAECGERNDLNAPNTNQFYEVPIYVTDDADTNATVAA